ncbi:AEG_G0003580.mRNA.1.CDS.1 [Saccharomyces cerevisiae]|nr:Ccz1p [Saccharomyces cerevisiae YJM470]AJQ13903.1 Ccz1p [Saccharomyces cerevisiae YJM1385]CAI4273161.1 APG_G0003360.mRNA.1.CDS.1 [Saccharomyces cerevisiae]CAI4274558.1 AEG_G0003580.mRNA.1.CDS.1 [Saccharomyces cerevisiae]CAI6499635.1 AEG_G0003580.mRNA.1.CDS.1 [Saccharomyces cerevisiae]
MRLHYITVFDPSRSTNENDTFKQLLLFHYFGTTDSIPSLNEKLSIIGVIQGIWSLTSSCVNKDGEDLEKIIELNNDIIFCIKVESRFFISLAISNISDDQSAIPFQYLSAYLWLSYRFFKLLNGSFSGFNKDFRKLTDLLNEFVIPFWNDIYLNLETVTNRSFTVMWPGFYKRANFQHSSYNPGEKNNVEESWDAIILQNILLDKKSYLGLKDILVYHLPKRTKAANRESMGTKTYGLVRNFTSDLNTLPDISNWLYHLHCTYGEISSHILTGNVHFKEELQVEEEQERSRDTNGRDEEESQEQQRREHQETTQNNTSELSLSERVIHNVTLPISFAYDAIHEVSTTTGVSGSLSMIMDYVPKPHWPFISSSNKSADKNNYSNSNDNANSNAPLMAQSEAVGGTIGNSRFGFLISPLNSDLLPSSYQALKLNLNFENSKDKEDFYNCLFWYFDDFLIVIVCDPDFNKICERDYLKDLSFQLCQSMECLNNEILNSQNCDNVESFAYVIRDNATKEIDSSVPFGSPKFTSDESISTLQLAINGIDQFINDNSNSLSLANWNPITIMGGSNAISKKNTTEGFGNGVNDNTQKFKRKYLNFLNLMSAEKLWDLQVDVLQFLASLQNSKRDPEYFQEERLLKLNNGVLCYIKENNSNLIIIIKNWFQNNGTSKAAKQRNRFSSDSSKGSSLFQSLGRDVTDWWESREI